MPVMFAHELGNPLVLIPVAIAALILFVSPTLLALAALVTAWRANRLWTRRLVICSVVLLAAELCVWLTLFNPPGSVERDEFVSIYVIGPSLMLGIPLGIDLLAHFLLGDREKRRRSFSTP